MYYIGSSSLSLARRKAAHHDAFKDDHIQWKLYKYWRSVGWENMRFEVLQDEIGNNDEKRKAEQWFINQIIRHKLLNQIKADCPNYEATRSINSPQGEIKKIEMKRKNRRDYHARKKNDEEWVNKQREIHRIKMKEKRNNEDFKEKEKERRKVYYEKIKNDEQYKERNRIKNKKWYDTHYKEYSQKMRIKKAQILTLPHETVPTTERAFAGEGISNPQ